MKISYTFFLRYFHKLEIVCESPMQSNGVSILFHDIQKVVDITLDNFNDAVERNEIQPLTVENCLLWFKNQLVDKLPPIVCIRLWKDRRRYIEV